MPVTCEKSLPSGTSLLRNLGKKCTDGFWIVLRSVSSTWKVVSACDISLKVQRNAILLSPDVRVCVWGCAGEQK